MALFETIKNIWNSKRIIKKIDTIIDDDNKSVKLIEIGIQQAVLHTFQNDHRFAVVKVLFEFQVVIFPVV